MTPDPEHLAQARKVADAVLYEGYLLYPYHQSSQKNQSRFQFGVLMPVAYAELDPSEPSASQTQCLVECADNAQVRITVRFLQLQRRGVEEAQSGDGPGNDDFRPVSTLTVDGQEFTAWDEAVEREEQLAVSVRELIGPVLDSTALASTTLASTALDITGLSLPFSFGPQTVNEDLTDESGRLAGRIVRTITTIYGLVQVSGERVAGPYGALRLTVKIENASVPAEPLKTREDGLAYALIATHALISVPGGSFISMTEPPEWASAEVAACQNTGVWPVLAGPPDCRDLMFSSPVILYDHAEVAPESGGDLFDATEIDEILTLRTLALTDAERQAARATDPRATELMDRLEGMPPEMFERLHGAIRYLNAVPTQSSSPQPGQDPLRLPTPGQNPLRLPTPGQNPLRRPSPGQSTFHQPAPGQTSLHQPTPGQNPLRRPSPGQSTLHQPAPGQDPLHQPAPGQNFLHQPAPGQNRLHQPAPGQNPLHLPSPGLDEDHRVPWWDPGADTTVSPDTDWVIVDGVPIARGSKIIMRPGGASQHGRRTDAQDIFLVGRRATVEAVLYDVDDKVHVAVTPDDDPAADLQRSHGRYLYFATDEIEPADRAGEALELKQRQSLITPTELEDPA